MQDRGEYIKTKVRGDGVTDDRVGVNESYEARIRGALSPLWLLVDLLTNERFGDKDPEFIKKVAQECKDSHCPKILSLLGDSENDRRELTEMIKKNIK